MHEIEAKAYLANGTHPQAEEAVAWASEQKAQLVDLKFCDLFGSWQHMTLPIGAFGTSAFTDGLGFDGSSIRGWQGIDESDLLLMPDPATAVLDPFTAAPTLSLVCEVADPTTGEAVRARSTPDRPPRRGVSRPDRDRRHGQLRARVRVLRLRRGLLRALAAPLALRRRFGRGPLELRRSRASATRCARRAATSRRRHTTPCTTCAPRSC